MIERRTFPTKHHGCEVTVVTERLDGGEWAVVASINHDLEDARRTIDLPVPERRFESQADAQDYGLRQAMGWLDQNMPGTQKSPD